METIGGSEQTVPTHAIVKMLGRSNASSGFFPAQDTITTGVGLRSVEGGNVIFSCEFDSFIIFSP